MELEKIIPEIHTITCVIYYKQLQELLNSILNRPVDKKKKDIILCKKEVYTPCKRIADFFKMKVNIATYLPEDIIIVLVKDPF